MGFSAQTDLGSYQHSREIHGLHQQGHHSRTEAQSAPASTNTIFLIVPDLNAFITRPASFLGFLLLKLLEMGKEV